MRKKNKVGVYSLKELERRAVKLERKLRNKKISFTHSKLKKLVVEWDRGYVLSKDEKRAVINHLMECESCEKILRRKHVLVEAIKR